MAQADTVTACARFVVGSTTTMGGKEDGMHRCVRTFCVATQAVADFARNCRRNYACQDKGKYDPASGHRTILKSAVFESSPNVKGRDTQCSAPSFATPWTATPNV